MNPKEMVSPSQMAIILLAFTLGSSIIFIPSPAIAAAGNGTWISVILSGTIGVPGLASVLYLHRLFPKETSIQYFRAVFGRWLGSVIGAFILFDLIIMIANITVGVGSFFTSTMMVDTPTYIFNSLIMVVAALTAQAGIEVAARLFTLFLNIMLVTIVVILISDIPVMDAGALLPQFAGDLGEIVHGSIITYGFPYSETFVFSALLCFVRPVKNEPLGKLMFVSYSINVAIFLAVILVAIMAFGEAAGERKFSLYELARVIELPGVIERTDAVAGITLIAGSYIKSTIALLALSYGLTHLFKLKDARAVIFPLTLFIIFMSLTMFSSEMEAQTFWTYGVTAVNTCCNVILMLAAAIAFARFHKKRVNA